jgi:UDP-3-O-[3-hydroxymyristoyl] glucosamine N-acyltransferase
LAAQLKGVRDHCVAIAANTTVDRARFASIIISRGTKVDNLV